MNLLTLIQLTTTDLIAFASDSFAISDLREMNFLPINSWCTKINHDPSELYLKLGIASQQRIDHENGIVRGMSYD